MLAWHKVLPGGVAAEAFGGSWAEPRELQFDATCLCQDHGGSSNVYPPITWKMFSILIQIGIMRNHYRVIPYIPKMAIFIGIIMVDQWIEGYPILRHTQIFVAGKQQQHLPALVLAQPKSSCFFESGIGAALRAEEWLRRMEKHGVKPNIICYNSVTETANMTNTYKQFSLDKYM